MAELFFILTTVFVAYVIFVVVDCEKKKNEASRKTAAPAKTQTATASPASAAVKKQPVAAVKPVTPARKAAATKPEAPAKPAPKVATDSIKNPDSGEVVKIASNYRFVKRWIKEALVAEGLVDKVYKNNELDDATLAKIDAALEKLKAMPKYQ